MNVELSEIFLKLIHIFMLKKNFPFVFCKSIIPSQKTDLLMTSGNFYFLAGKIKYLGRKIIRL